LQNIFKLDQIYAITSGIDNSAIFTIEYQQK